MHTYLNRRLYKSNSGGSNMEHTYSIEQLYHFNCANCRKWWTISDFKLTEETELSCPICKENRKVKQIKPLPCLIDDEDLLDL